MQIPASRFTDIPEGCPVWRGDTFGYWHTSQPTRQGELGWMDLTTTEPASHEGLTVDLSTPAPVRAFAPALIMAVKRLLYPPEHPPAAVWSRSEGAYVLLEEVTMSGLLVYAPAAANELPITGSTPEEALLNGLKAALDAAKDAQ